MTDHTSRNTEIIRAYVDGEAVPSIAARFKLSRPRLYQILKETAKVRKPSDRDAFLGISVTAGTRDALKVKAKKHGVSVSKLASDALDEVVR